MGAMAEAIHRVFVVVGEVKAGKSSLLNALFGQEFAKVNRRTFHPGPRVEPSPAKASPSSLMAFAYVATPAVPGQTGVRTFCGDASGRICYATGVVVPELGVCPKECTPF